MKKLICALFALLLIFSPSLAAVLADESVGYISYNTGKDTNDGLTAATAKKTIGGAGGKGVFSIVKNGGTVVVAEKMYFGTSYTWKATAPTVITAAYDGVDYKNLEPTANPASGVIKMKHGAVLTISSDVTLDDIILHSEHGAEKIVVSAGATLTLTESVITTSLTDTYYKIEVEKGARAVINGGKYASISGEGEWSIGADATIGKGEQFDANGVVGFVAAGKGSNDNNGFSEETPKSGLGQMDGNGIVSVVAQGGTVVVSGKMSVSTNFAWSANGKVIVTGSYGGKDYKDSEPSNNPDSGAVRFADGVTFTVGTDLVFDDVILYLIGSSANIVVSPGATLTISESVLTTSGKSAYLNVYVSKGAKANINGGTYASVSGEGSYTIGEGVRVLSDKPTINANIPLKTSAAVCYLDQAKGKNTNDGETAAGAVKGYSDGLFKRILGGGTVVVSGGSLIGGSPYNMTQTLMPLTFTSNYDGKDYKTEDGCTYRFSKNTTLVISSDVIYDDIILHESSGQTTIKVTNGATLTVTDKAVLTSTADGGKHYTVIVEKGCFAILSEEAQKRFKIEGEGTVLTYVDGKSELFSHYLGND